MAKGTVERGIENVFDGLFSRAFRSGIKPLQIGRRLLQVVDAERQVDAQGRRVVPNSYLVQLSPADREGFADLEPAMHQELTIALREHVSQEGYYVEGKPRVAFHTNPDLKKGRFEIEARNVDQGAPAPATTPAPAASTEPAPAEPPTLTVVHDAFDRPPAVLTLPGGQRVEIREGHYVVGRSLDSDVVVNDSNVSRRHAEFVCAAGEVVVRDLGSTNGTKVNGVAVSGEQILRHGDVIGLGSVTLTFEAT
jgi:hypothetical protein